jgi:hypothetical protein
MLSLFLQLLFCSLHAAHFVIRLLKRLLLSLSKPATPLELDAPPRRVIKDLALVLVTSPDYKRQDDSSDEAEALIECVKRVAGWSRLAGVETLTVYEREGVAQPVR